MNEDKDPCVGCSANIGGKGCGCHSIMCGPVKPYVKRHPEVELTDEDKIRIIDEFNEWKKQHPDVLVSFGYPVRRW